MYWLTMGEIINAWKSYYEHLRNEEFPWNMDILEAVEPVQGPPPEIENEWVKKAIDEMRNGKAASSTGIVAEMLKASGDIGVNLITKLGNAIIRETSIPDNWLKSVMVNIYKGKCDALVRSNCRGLKLLDYGMKVVERESHR